jgi:hypothetical protein
MLIEYTGSKKKIFWVVNGQPFFKIIDNGEVLDMPVEVYQDYINNNKFTPVNKKVKGLQNKKNDNVVGKIDGSEPIANISEVNLQQGETNDA